MNNLEIMKEFKERCKSQNKKFIKVTPFGNPETKVVHPFFTCSNSYFDLLYVFHDDEKFCIYVDVQRKIHVDVVWRDDRSFGLKRPIIL